jgi:hypothetical protein
MTLQAIKVAHTLAWAFFASCVLGIPLLARRADYLHATILIGVVFIEVCILVFNGWRCPLTPLAARYTADRRDNFDIYLPVWLARYNKQIFGTLYGAGIIYTLCRWLGAQP